MPARRFRFPSILAILLLFAAGLLQILWGQRRGGPASTLPEEAEFHFLRVEYRDFYGARRGFGGFGGFGRGWWMQDWPAAEIHFSEGIRRLTRINIGLEKHLPLLDDRIYEYPWIYATQTGYWDLSDEETDRLRDYLLRGGFLMTDDFHGPDDWQVFEETMRRVFPDQDVLELEQSDPLMHVLYDINERTYIPGLRHLAYAPGGQIVVQPEYIPPHWRALRDPQGRLVVAINFNMDIGDAWEHADLPQYPEAMTRLSYYFGINYIIYAMTH
jgi:hypothetical protein